MISVGRRGKGRGGKRARRSSRDLEKASGDGRASSRSKSKEREEGKEERKEGIEVVISWEVEADMGRILRWFWRWGGEESKYVNDEVEGGVPG